MAPFKWFSKPGVMTLTPFLVTKCKHTNSFAPNPYCPLFVQYFGKKHNDTWDNWLGGCRHSEVSDLRIARHSEAMHMVKLYIDMHHYGASMAYYNFGKTDGSTYTQRTLHTDLVLVRMPAPTDYRNEPLTQRPDPNGIIVKNWSRVSLKPQGRGRLKQATNGPLISVQIMELTFASGFKLEEPAVRKHAKCSNVARISHRLSGKLDTALAFTGDFANISLEQQAKWETDNYRRLDTTFGGAASCRPRNAGWIVDELPAVLTLR